VGLAAFIIGLLSILGMAIGFIPLLGWFNWLNIPFAFIGLVLGIVVVARSKNSYALAGAIMAGLAIAIGTFRLAIGGGIL
jgi:hypothetical protein